MKNKAYIGIAFIILVFGIIFIPKIVDRVKSNKVVQGDRLDNVSGNKSNGSNGLEVIGVAPSFSLKDQNGKEITNESYKGKVYVVEFFFTTCPTICPRMNQNMLSI